MLRSLVQAFIICLIPTALFAQHGMAPSGGYAFDVPRLRVAGELRSTDVSFPISHIDERSQQLVNLSIELIHGFWTYESERYLREVILKYPDHPMPLILAAHLHTIFGSGNMERALVYFDKAVNARNAYTKTLTERELMWFDAISKLFLPEVRSPSQKKLLYTAALEGIVEKFADDFEAKAFLALAYWSFKLVPNSNFDDPDRVKLAQKVDRLIEDVLAHNWNHPAHHYKIHLWNENQTDYKALASARQLAQAQPHVAHLWHMPAHTFAGNKDYFFAWRHSEIAHRVDNQQLAERGLMPSQQHNYYHNYVDFSLPLKTRIGQIVDATARSVAMLKHGRLSFAMGKGYHLHTADILLGSLETYQRWNDFANLDVGGIFSGLESGMALQDTLYAARLLRMRVLSALHQGMNDEQVASRLKPLWSLQNEDDIARPYYEDAFIQREIALRARSGLIPEALIRKLKVLGITPKAQVLEMSVLANHVVLSQELFAELKAKFAELNVPELLSLWNAVCLDVAKKARFDLNEKQIRAQVLKVLMPDEHSGDSLSTLSFASRFPDLTRRLIDEARTLTDRRFAALPDAFSYLKEHQHESMNYSDPVWPTFGEY